MERAPHRRGFPCTHVGGRVMESQEDIRMLLDRLIAGWENEIVEFKKAGTDFTTNEIGKYFSALANEANLKGVKNGWLVFGVHDKTRKIVGTDYDASPATVDRQGGLKYQIAQSTMPSVCFNEIYNLMCPEGLVILFKIPAAPQGIPIGWKGHFYARAGENLIPMGWDKLEAIRRQGSADDWSAVVVEGVTFDDLDPEALAYARKEFATKHALEFPAEEVTGWNLPTFLDKARLTVNGRITRATLLLVGKELSAQQFLSPYPAQLVWKLVGEEKANEIFGPPFLLTTSKLYSRIRNVEVRIKPNGWLVPTSVPKYKDSSVLELLHNCIAHQDYLKNGRVVVTEYVDRLSFLNLGSFYEGRPEDYVGGKKTPSRYRNLQLVKAMREINMIDTMGYGIHRLYEWQIERFFPLPDYDAKPDSVEATIYGRVVDEAYTSLLMQRSDLPFDDIWLLDRIQKGLPIDDDSIVHLRRERLIEGRKSHIRVSAKIAELTGQKAEYMKKKGLPSAHYREMLRRFIMQFNGVSRQEINGYMFDEIREELSVDEKMAKISNMLTYLRKTGHISNIGTDKKSLWVYIGKRTGTSEIKVNINENDAGRGFANEINSNNPTENGRINADMIFFDSTGEDKESM